MRKLIIIVFGVLSLILNGQNVGINTQFPKEILHIDAKKDNNNESSSVQSSNDIVISRNGNMMVGGVNPTSKFEIKSNINNISGLRFENLTNASQNTTLPNDRKINYLGVDDQGNVIISGKDDVKILKTIENNITYYKNVLKNNDGTTNTTLVPWTWRKTYDMPNTYSPSIIVPGSEVRFSIPDGKPRAVFMNFMMGFALTFSGLNNANGSEVFGAEIVIEKISSPTSVNYTGVSQVSQVPSSLPTRQMYSINYITDLASGDYEAKIRIITKRFVFSGAPTSSETPDKLITFTPIQYSYNISFFES